MGLSSVKLVSKQDQHDESFNRYHHASHTRRDEQYCAVVLGGSSSLFHITFRCYSHVSEIKYLLPALVNRFGSVSFWVQLIYLFFVYYIYIHIYIYMYICICIVCIDIYIYIHIQRHIVFHLLYLQCIQN